MNEHDDPNRYSHSAWPTLTEPVEKDKDFPSPDGPAPIMARCPVSGQWKDAISDQSGTSDNTGDYAFLLRCGHLYIGHVEDH